jgi:ubiquinone/menaquinone biosynthesis C-methylase UbiE
MFACPYCFTKLDDNLNCSCGYQGLFINGIYRLHKFDESWIDCETQDRAHDKAIDWSAKQTLGVTAGQAITEEEIKRSAFVNSELRKEALRLLGNIENKLFLDIGCSEGTTVIPFVKQAIVIGLDINLKLLETAKTVIPTVVLGDGRFLPFEKEIFDIVFDSASLHHFLDKKLLLNNIYRVLKPGGIYVSVGNPPSGSKQIEIDDALARSKWYWDMFNLIETQPTKEEYEADFKEIFNNFEYCSVAGDNSIMKVVKV